MDVKSLLVKLGFDADHRPLEGVEHRLEGIKERLEFLGAAEVLRGLFELAERFSGMGEAIETAAISAGITAEAFQKMAYAAAQNGVGQDELQTALAKLNRQLFEAKRGSEGAVKAFADAGISQETLSSWQNSQEALYGVADAMNQMTDVSARQAVMMELAGRGSFKLVKYVTQGADGMKRLESEAESMGAVVSNAGIEGLAKLEDSLSGFWSVIKSVGAAIGATFAPSVIFLTKRIEKLWSANQKLIELRVNDWIYKIAYGMGYAYGAIEIVVTKFIELVREHPRLITAVGRLIFILGGLSIGVSLVLNVINRLKTAAKVTWEVMKLFGGHESIFRPFATSVLNFAVWPISMLRKALAGVLLRLALLAETALPGVSAALYSMAVAINATGLPLFAAILAGVVLAGQAFYTWLTGGKVEDMWLYKLVAKVMKLPGALTAAYNWLTGKETKDEDADGAVVKGGKREVVGTVFEDPDIAAMKMRGHENGVEGGEAEQQGLANQMLRTMAKQGQMPGTMDLLSQIYSKAPGAVASMQAPSAIRALPGKQPDVLSSGGYTVQSTTNITVQGSADPKRVEKAVQSGVREHLDSVHRNAMRAIKQAQVS